MKPFYFLYFLLFLVILLSCSGCAVRNETLYIAEGLVTMQIIDNKPKIRVASGLDDCKWRARVKVHDLDGGNHEIWLKCKIPFSM